MATITGQRQSFGFRVATGNNDLENEALDISSVLDILRPTETPVLLLIGRDSTRDPVTAVKHEWLEDEVRGLSTTTTDADLDNTTPGVVALTVAAGEGLKFRGTVNDDQGPSDIVRITSGAGEELARVTASTSTTVSVERGYGSWSTPVNHTGFTKTVTIMSSMQSQGLATIGESRTTTKVNKFNYTQIFEDTLKASATYLATDKIISRDDMDLQRQNLTEIMGMTMERALIYGKRQAPAATDPGAMDGIRAVVATNVYNKAGAPLTPIFLEDALEAMWQAGADPETVYVLANSTQRRRINTFLDPYRQAGYNDERLGTFVTRYDTPFGVMNMVLARSIDQSEVLIVDRRRIGFGPLRPLGESPIAPTSREARTWQWTGEYTSEVRLEKSHARIFNLATTGIL